MALLERVGTLLRANINDLIERAEDPEKLLKQLVLDMQNQLMQVKTQVAIAIADQHLLEKKQREYQETAEAWRRKAELAVNRGQDDLARGALNRVLSQQQMAQAYNQQLEDQRTEADTLRHALRRLEEKLKETQARCELLVAQHRRTRALGRAQEARTALDGARKSTAMERMRARIDAEQSLNGAKGELLDGGDSLDDRMELLEREGQIEQLLIELKEKQKLLA